MKLLLYTDGGARGNPGPAAIGVILKNEAEEKIAEKGLFIGNTTNNLAEYTALVEGLILAHEKNPEELTCFLDSELVVKQLHGFYKVKNLKIRLLFEKVRSLEKSFKNVTYKHVSRHLNAEADVLVNKVLDAKYNA